MGWCCWIVSVLHREVVDLQNVVVPSVARLSVRHIHNKEFWGDLCHASSLLEECWHHLVWFWFPHDKLLPVLRMPKDIGIDKRLALITDHVAIDLNIVTLETHDNRDKFWHFEANRVIK